MDKDEKDLIESGRTVQIFHIGSVGQMNPNATTVTNNYYGDQFVPQNDAVKKCGNKSSVEADEKREQVLAYVCKVESLLCDKWRDIYGAFWQAIIELPTVRAEIYNRGKQQNTTFNRKLVAQILHLIGEKYKAFGPRYNATVLAEMLEGSKDASVRGELGFTVGNDQMLSEIERKIAEILK